jgi:YD repeat-containing protein
VALVRYVRERRMMAGHPVWPINVIASAAKQSASAQQGIFYDSGGNVVGRSSTDSQGSTTSYDSRGKVISRESTSGNTTTVHDASGRNIGRFTTSREGITRRALPKG